MPAYGNYDAEFNSQISRYDFAQILACARVQALIRPVVLLYQSATGYTAGTVLGQYTSGVNNGLFGPYSNGGSSGLGTAMCILLVDAIPVVGVPFGSPSGTLAAPAVFRGNVYYSAVSGTLDSNAITNLGGRKISDATGVTLFVF